MQMSDAVNYAINLYSQNIDIYNDVNAMAVNRFSLAFDLIKL